MTRGDRARSDGAAVDKVGKFGRSLFLVIGIVSMLVGVWQCCATARFLRHASAATGHVIGPGAHPEIAFRTASGAMIRYRQNGMGERPVGTSIPLLYDPAAPAETAVANSFWQLWPTSLLPLWIGIGFTGLILLGAEVEVRGLGVKRTKR